ncbi:hypothetical protein DENSPDRAFT_596640 [Dentipellis sp. KUC8613]|nr:hypothetical protein DENSPDRAFT_596640 [Dentipellis sp. KUC8613]
MSQNTPADHRAEHSIELVLGLTKYPSRPVPAACPVRSFFFCGLAKPRDIFGVPNIRISKPLASDPAVIWICTPLDYLRPNVDGIFSGKWSGKRWLVVLIAVYVGTFRRLRIQHVRYRELSYSLAFSNRVLIFVFATVYHITPTNIYRLL